MGLDRFTSLLTRSDDGEPTVLMPTTDTEHVAVGDLADQAAHAIRLLNHRTRPAPVAWPILSRPPRSSPPSPA